MNTNRLMDNMRNKIYVCDAHFPSLCNLHCHKMEHLAKGHYSCVYRENAYMDNDVGKLHEVKHTSQMQILDNISNDAIYSSFPKTEDLCSLNEQHNDCSIYAPSTPVSGIRCEENAKNYADIKSHLCDMCGEAFHNNVDICLHLKCHNMKKSALLLDPQLNLACHDDHVVTNDQIDRTIHIPKQSGETSNRKSINDQTVTNCPQIENERLAQLVKRYNVFNLRKSVNSNNVCISTKEHVEDNISCWKDNSATMMCVSDFDSNDNSNDDRQLLDSTSADNVLNADLNEMPLEDNVHNLRTTSEARIPPDRTPHSPLDVISNDNLEDNEQLIDSTSTENLKKADLCETPLEDNANNLKATFLPRTRRDKMRHRTVGKRRHVCDVCGKAFKKYGNLIVHYRVHSGQRPFPCTICDKKFTQNVALQDHLRLHTGSKPFKCSFCPKSFAQKVNMRSHERIHFGSRPYRCIICDKQFSQTNGVQGHMMLHTGCKPYKCSFCDKSFAQKVNTEKHERIHTGVKPYKCKVCPSTFAQLNHLTKHSRTHTGEQPYTCRTCNKKFTQSSNLKTHMMTHTGEKPHKCSICDKRFIQSNNLRKHVKIHASPGQQHQCVMCQSSFARKVNIVKHIKKCHGVKDYKKHIKKLNAQNKI